VTAFIGASRYERTDERADHRAGQRARTLGTTAGVIDDLPVPRTRGGFHTQLFDRYQCRMAEVDTLMRDMFVGGGSQQSVGLLPLAVAETGRRRVRPSPDSTLFLFLAARDIVERTGMDDPFVRKSLYPALVRAFVRLRGKRRRWAWVTHEGLLAQGEDGVGLTWMDARIEGEPVTPRQGYAVEIDALAYNAAHFATGWAERQRVSFARAFKHRLRDAAPRFMARFWNERRGYLADARDGARQDGSLRPNQLWAMALPHRPVSQAAAEASATIR
jgi:glycogen debranching enzyme